ncbi:cell division control protein 6 homolog [Physella acuta]|uniref:cell division control protein 6 homolog n=1 Tax=Physella acuta TaxID=109671 RepID=UPI0027DD5F64|nr:cell division control protein 6 homolog [Physella acuta]
MAQSLTASFTVRKSTRLSSRSKAGKIELEGKSSNSPHTTVNKIEEQLSSLRKRNGSFPDVRALLQHKTISVDDGRNSAKSVELSPERNAVNSVLDLTPQTPSADDQVQLRHTGLTGDLDRVCRRLLSPKKRKSNEENDLSSLSPVKSPRASHAIRSPLKSSYLSPISLLRSPETPTSTKKGDKEPKSTPRRLFKSPHKKVSEISPLVTCLTVASNSSVPSLQLYKSSTSSYQSAKRSLHTAKPEYLIGRDTEEADIEKFICEKLDKKTSGSLYISGAPGTGKTAVVTHVIDKLKAENRCLRTAVINCMMLKDSNVVFRQMYEQLEGSPIKSKDSMKAVEKLFMTSKDNILLVLDEIDQLDSKHQHILYRIFEWPGLESSKLILIGIANALDLTDRVLPRLQASTTCRPNLMNFAPYTSAQITDILKQRLEKEVIIEPSAINFCARKVSAVAGDMRKALDVCRRAVEMVESDVRTQQVLKPTDCNSPTKKHQQTPMKKVTIAHISKVMSEVYGSSVTSSSSCENSIPLQQKLAVCSLLLLVKNGKVKEVLLGKLHETYVKVCKRQQMPSIDQSEFFSVLTFLDSRGVIALKKAKDTRLTKVSLKLDESELEQTLKDKSLMATILNAGIPK